MYLSFIATWEWSENSWSEKSVSSTRLKHALSESTRSMNCSCLATKLTGTVTGVGVKAGEGTGVEGTGVTIGGGVGVTGLGAGVGVAPNIKGGLSAIIGIFDHPVTGNISASISALVHVPCTSKQTV